MRTICINDKVIIRPDYPGQSGFLMTCPRKISSPGMTICPGFGFVSQICPNLPISAAVCLHIDGQTLASQTHKSDPRRLVPVVLSPYNSRLRHSSRIAEPKLWLP